MKSYIFQTSSPVIVIYSKPYFVIDNRQMKHRINSVSNVSKRSIIYSGSWSILAMNVKVFKALSANSEVVLNIQMINIAQCTVIRI